MCSLLFFFICYHFLCKYDLLVTSQCHLLIVFSNSLDPDQARKYVGSDLDPNCLTLMVFMNSKYFFGKVYFEEKKESILKQITKNHEKILIILICAQLNVTFCLFTVFSS